MLSELMLNRSKAFRRERIDRRTGVELEQYLDSSATTAIMGAVVLPNVIQKSNA
jgi:hypothetical protein